MPRKDHESKTGLDGDQSRRRNMGLRDLTMIRDVARALAWINGRYDVLRNTPLTHSESAQIQQICNTAIDRIRKHGRYK